MYVCVCVDDCVHAERQVGPPPLPTPSYYLVSPSVRQNGLQKRFRQVNCYFFCFFSRGVRANLSHCFALLCSGLLWFALLRFALLCFVVLYFALLCFALRCFALFCFALLYVTLLSVCCVVLCCVVSLQGLRPGTLPGPFLNNSSAVLRG